MKIIRSREQCRGSAFVEYMILCVLILGAATGVQSYSESLQMRTSDALDQLVGGGSQSSHDEGPFRRERGGGRDIGQGQGDRRQPG